MSQKMKIRITDENQEKIQKELDKAQKGYNARLCNFKDAKDIVEMAEEHLETFRVPKKYWVGCKVTYSESVECNSYGSYNALSTKITAQRFSSGWFLVGIDRVSKSTRRGVDQCHFLPSSIAYEAMARIAKEDFRRKFPS